MLSALQEADELKDGTNHFDLELVIGYYLEVSHNFPEYGLEGKYVAWRKEATELFQYAKLINSKSVYTVHQRLKALDLASYFDSVEDAYGEEMEKVEEETDRGRDDGPWNWNGNATLTRYKQKHRPLVKPEKHQYDITKMTRAQRAKHSINGKDPLADWFIKDLKKDFLDLV